MKKNKEIIDRYVDKKGRSKNYMQDAVLLLALSVVLTILAFMNLKVLKPMLVIAIILVSVVLVCFIKAMRLRRWMFYVSENEVIYRTARGEETSIPMSEISGYKWGKNGEVILYHGDKPVFVMDELDESENVIFVLKISGVKNLDGNKDEFIITESNLEKGIAVFCVVVSVLILSVGLCGKPMVLILPGIIFTIFASVHAVRIFSNKIIVADEQFHREILFGKSGVWTFKEIEKVKGIMRSRDEYYLFYVDGKVCFKVNLRSKNGVRLRRLVDKKRWHIGTYHSR